MKGKLRFSLAFSAISTSVLALINSMKFESQELKNHPELYIGIGIFFFIVVWSCLALEEKFVKRKK